MPDDFQVKNAGVEAKLKEIGHIIGDQMPEGFGFTLLMFDYGEGGGMFYMSSAKREDMIKAMKEFINRQETE